MVNALTRRITLSIAMTGLVISGPATGVTQPYWAVA